MALIFVISSFEVRVPGVEHLPWKDKGIHFVEYGVLGWLCAAASTRSWPSAPAWRTAAFAVFVSVLWGLSDEVHQALVPGRSSELADLVADLFGSIAGASAWHFFRTKL
ncbi:MAG: VanZ family protein [Polyangiales bacterium]|jgi:VanZ family protein